MVHLKAYSRLFSFCLFVVITGLVLYCIHGFSANKAILDCTKKRYRDSLHNIGLKYGTDKVYSHHYEIFYEKYLTQYRDTSIRILEIGLGCGMERGTGASAQTWREYFGSRADIHFLEYNKLCGKKWYEMTGKKLNITMHYGSQEDVSFLHQFTSNMQPFDIIIDDGGHTMNQQKTSFIMLLPLVRSGGIYVIEDLETSYVSRFYDTYTNASTTITFIKDIIDEIQSGAPQKYMSIAKRVSSLEIGDSICFFTVK